MAKKSFGAGATKPGILNTDGGEKLKEMQAKIQYNFKYIPKEKIVSNPKNEMYTQDGIEALKESILIICQFYIIQIMIHTGWYLVNDVIMQ